MASTSERLDNSDYVLSGFSDTILTLKNTNVAPRSVREPDVSVSLGGDKPAKTLGSKDNSPIALAIVRNTGHWIWWK
jgi:hypothetical protein